jgi:hypothetical protein
MPGRASDRDLITPSPFAGAVISLDLISVRIGDEGGVVIGPIHRPQTGRAVVMPAGAQRRCVKRIDGRGIWRAKQKCKPDLSSAGTRRSAENTQNEMVSVPYP